MMKHIERKLIGWWECKRKFGGEANTRMCQEIPPDLIEWLHLRMKE